MKLLIVHFTCLVLKYSGLMRIKYIRKLYWEYYSFIIVKKWDNIGDYNLIGSIIDKYKCKSILDFGAGGGAATKFISY